MLFADAIDLSNSVSLWACDVC